MPTSRAPRRARSRSRRRPAWSAVRSRMRPETRRGRSTTSRSPWSACRLQWKRRSLAARVCRGAEGGAGDEGARRLHLGRLHHADQGREAHLHRMSRFALAVTALLAVAYAYIASRLASGGAAAVALAVPFLLIWIMPVVYWGTGRSREGFLDQLLHRASYLSMAWVSFALVLTLARDLALFATTWTPAAHAMVAHAGVPVVLGGSLVAIAIGAAAAFRGPRVEQVDLPIAGLHPDLEGLRIVQISDLHVGPNIGLRYVQRVVELSRSLNPDIVALTG